MQYFLLIRNALLFTYIYKDDLTSENYQQVLKKKIQRNLHENIWDYIIKYNIHHIIC